MSTSTITIEISQPVYDTLVQLAEAEHIEPEAMLAQIVMRAAEQDERLRAWSELQAEIERRGSKFSEMTAEEIVEEMRKTREEVFDANYAHLYR